MKGIYSAHPKCTCAMCKTSGECKKRKCCKCVAQSSLDKAQATRNEAHCSSLSNVSQNLYNLQPPARFKSWALFLQCTKALCRPDLDEQVSKYTTMEPPPSKGNRLGRFNSGGCTACTILCATAPTAAIATSSPIAKSPSSGRASCASQI